MREAPKSVGCEGLAKIKGPGDAGDDGVAAEEDDQRRDRPVGVGAGYECLPGRRFGRLNEGRDGQARLVEEDLNQEVSVTFSGK